MTTTLGAPSHTSPRRTRAVGLDVLVGAAVVVGWVLYRHYLFDGVSRRVFRWHAFLDHWWMYTLGIALLLCLPYAAALLVWGRGLTARATGAVVAVASGLFLWAWDRVFQNYVLSPGSAPSSALRIYVWGSLLGIAALVPLAWGLARRSGRGWVPGILVGPVVAAALRELQLHWTWWQDRVLPIGHDYHWQAEAAVFMAPFVLAVLTCWAIEARHGSSA